VGAFVSDFLAVESVQLSCDGDGVYYVEILTLGMLDDYQFTVGRHFHECSTLFPGTTVLSLLISFYNVALATVNLPYLFCCSPALTLTLSLKQMNR